MLADADHAVFEFVFIYAFHKRISGVKYSDVIRIFAQCLNIKCNEWVMMNFDRCVKDASIIQT